MSKYWGQFSEVQVLFSEKKAGSMVWWNRLPVEAVVKENRDNFFRQNKIDPTRVVSGGIAHIATVRRVGESDAGQYLLDADAMVSNEKNIFLSVTAADCLPVFFFDHKQKCFGIAHAGWRGLVAGVLENVVEKMTQEFATQASDIQVVIGPHICAACYEVGREVAEQFYPENVFEKNGKIFADLASEAKQRLQNQGVHAIEISAECTYENSQKYFSARRDKAVPLCGMMAVIGIM